MILEHPFRETKMQVLLKSSKSEIHTAYKEIIDYPPAGVEYLPDPDKISKDRLLRAAAYYFKSLNIGIAPENIDLTHSHQQLILNKVPWVVDIDHSSAFSYFNRNKLLSNKNTIERCLSSRYCKKIMTWSADAKKSLDSTINTSQLGDKIEVVYPAYHKVDYDRPRHDSLNLLFVGRHFHRKGGLETMKAFSILSKRYDINLSVISPVPEHVREGYKSYQNISFYSNLPIEQLLKIYSSADIFIFPTYYEIFGIVFLEAMAFGLPIITLDGFATSEIIENGKNGYLIKPYSKLWFGEDYLPHHIWGDWKVLKTLLSEKEQDRIVNDIVDKLSILIDSDTLRRKMGAYGRSMIENGKFSIEERNKKLKRIYKEAIE